MGEVDQKTAMKSFSFAVAFIPAALTALAFRADKASLGAIIITSVIVGAAVLATAWRASPRRVQTAIGFIYLGAISLCNVGSDLINKAVGNVSDGPLLSSATVLVSIGLGWAICKTAFGPFD